MAEAESNSAFLMVIQLSVLKFELMEAFMAFGNKFVAVQMGKLEHLGHYFAISGAKNVYRLRA